MKAVLGAAMMAALACMSPGRAQVAEQRLPACLACHGAQGVSGAEGVPSLGAMPPEYVLTQLYLFREKMRAVPVMNAMASGLSDDDLQTLGERLNALPAPVGAANLGASEVAEAEGLVGRYRCASCHGAGLVGHGQIPRLAGQREDYLLKSLREYKSNARAGYEPAMNEVSQEIKDADIPVLARYVAQLK